MAQQISSPVTGVIKEEEVLLDFGKHEGLSVSEIQEVDRDFYDRLIDENSKGIFSIRRHKDKRFRLYINPLSKMDH